MSQEKTTMLTKEGHIFWNRPDLKQELWNFAKYNIFQGTYVTTPTSLRVAREAMRFANQHNIQFKADKELNTYLRDPGALVKYHQTKMVELSHATKSDLTLKENLRVIVSQSVLAGIQYAMLAPRCIIAEPSMDDRAAIALGVLNQIKDFRCLLVCRKDRVHYWYHKIAELLNGNLAISQITGIGNCVPPRTIVIAETNYLERNHDIPAFPTSHGIPTECIIVDDAHLFKNDNSNRTKNLRALSSNFRYQFMLTDYPVDLSYADLGVLVQILRRDEEFEDLYGLLRKASRDPLENRARNRWVLDHQGLLRKLYQKLRATCMVRHSEDLDLNIHEYTAHIELSSFYPDDLQSKKVKHPLHDMGIKKIAGSVDWLRLFLQQASGKTLIFAHHNTVIKNLAEALNIPAYYGKTVSKKERGRISEMFQKDDRFKILIVANDMQITWDVSNVSNVVFVELPRSPRLYDKLLSSVAGNDIRKRVSVIFLLSQKTLDQRAYYRLQYREEEYDSIMDGEKRYA